MISRALRSTLPLAVVALLLASCGAGNAGTPTSGSSPVTTASVPSATASASAGPSTENLDPCTLVAVNGFGSIAKFGKPEAAEVSAGVRTCRFIRVRASASDDALTVSVIARDLQAIDTVSDQGGGLAPGDVNGRKAVKAPIPPTGCTIAMAVGKSRVDIASVSTDSDAACVVAEKAAKIVEPKLPKG